MRKTSVFKLALLVLLSLPAISEDAHAEGFPGKGDEDAWSDALPYYNRGNRYLQKEQYQQALEDFKVAVGKYTFDPDFYTNLGVAYRKVGDYTNAEDAYKKSIQLNDKDWMPWNDLANVYLKQDKLKETVATFQRALKCNPPAKDKAAIQQDILDINKILRMQAPPKVANTPAAAPGSANSAGTGAAKKVSAKPQAQPISTAKPADKKELKGSGWDYVYDGKN
ncbi:MAG: tetratricopeptide repeat protein [Cyanobacteria bacterium SZAS-4]|nr:tetratricopeptide repeat protein [Cyanobacteria bacterium SZAS-4]